MTAKEESISFQVNSDQLDVFCQKIISRSRNVCNTHEALTVMEAFITTFISDSKGSESYQNLTTATSNIDREKIPQLAHWVINWTDEAKNKAEQASGYPDALNFKKANMNIEEYQAMSDIAYFFKHTFEY